MSLFFQIFDISSFCFSRYSTKQQCFCVSFSSRCYWLFLKGNLVTKITNTISFFQDISYFASYVFKFFFLTHTVFENYYCSYCKEKYSFRNITIFPRLLVTNRNNGVLCGDHPSAVQGLEKGPLSRRRSGSLGSSSWIRNLSEMNFPARIV